MSLHLGSYNTATTRTHVGFQFSTHQAAGGNVAPLSAIDAADIKVYKATDGAAFSSTPRASASGITVTSPFNSLTGVHDVDIDLTDNTTAGFWAAGCRYSVMLQPDTETIDGQTITGVVLAYFEIGPPPANVVQVAGTPQTAGDLAGILGALNAAASSGDPGTTTSLVQYLKQIVNTLEGSAGIPTFPAAAAPGNAVSLAEAIRGIYALVAAVPAISTSIGDAAGTELGELYRLLAAAHGGKASGLPIAPKYRDLADSKNVIDATTDTDGNRTAVTLDLS